MASTLDDIMKMSGRLDQGGLKGVKVPQRLRRRLSRFKNKRRSRRSKEGDERLAQEPLIAEDEKVAYTNDPFPGTNNPSVPGESSQDDNKPFPNEDSGDPLLAARVPYPGESSTDAYTNSPSFAGESSQDTVPFPGESSQDASNNPFPNEDSGDPILTKSPTFSGESSQEAVPFPGESSQDAPNNPFPNEDSGDPLPTFPGESSQDAPNNPFPNEDSGDPLPTFPGESPQDTVPFPGESSQDAPNNPFPNEDSGDPLLDDENLFSRTGNPTIAPIAHSTTIPPNGGPNRPTAGERPSVPEDSGDQSPITPPGAPVKPPKPSYPPAYPPAYFQPLPTPRPTKYRPSVPTAPKPTRRPSKLSPRPTITPTVSPQPSSTPTLSSRPTFSNAPSKMPTRMPVVTKMPMITKSPSKYDTDAPTFKQELPLETGSPTFRETTPTLSPTGPDELPITTDPLVPPPTAPTNPPTQDPANAPTPAPTESTNPTSPMTPQPTDFDASVCEANEEGNYGFPTAPENDVIQYRYQVEATSGVTVDNLNNRILLEIEKDISDVLVPALFFQSGECDDVAQIRSQGFDSIKKAEATSDKRAAQKWAMDILEQNKQNKKPRGSRTDGWDSPPGRRQLWSRDLQEEEGRLVGLTATPPDFVVRGRLQNACPFPVSGTGPDGQPLICWVIDGAVTVFGAGDLSWAQPIVQESLKQAMDSGQFDNGVVNPNVIYVRNIPPGTVLNVTTDQIQDGEKVASGGTPPWAWVLIALGIAGVLLIIVYLVIKRKKQQEEFDRQQAETEFFAGASGDEKDEGGEGDEDDENANLVGAVAEEDDDVRSKEDDKDEERDEQNDDNESKDDNQAGDEPGDDVFNDDDGR